MITILYNIQPPLFQCQGLSGSKLSEKGIGIGRNRCRFAFLAQLHLLQASVPANFCEWAESQEPLNPRHKTRWLDIVLVSEYSYLLHFIIRDQISKYLYAKIILENALFLYPFVGMMQYSGSLCFLWTESLSS